MTMARECDQGDFLPNRVYVFLPSTEISDAAKRKPTVTPPHAKGNIARYIAKQHYFRCALSGLLEKHGDVGEIYNIL